MNNTQAPETVTMKQIADQLRVKPRTIKYWLGKAQSGDLRFKDFPFHQIGARCSVRFSPDQVLRWYNQHFHIG